jgi:3alpha(or 20beta)-hydroxysteroid dehydrogenase
MDDLGGQVASSIGDAAIFCHLDVTSSDSWKAAVDATVAAFGKLDILVNNAGIWPFGTIEEMPEETFMQTIAINQLGVWLGMKSVIAPMRAAGGGAIVNTSSLAGLTGMPGLGAYVGTKHAVRGLSKTAALELGRYGIRVNSIYPGAIVGDAKPEGVTEEMLEGMFSHLPVPRVGHPDDIAKAMLYLVSDDSSYVTGAEIVVDGGSIAGVGDPAGGRTRE